MQERNESEVDVEGGRPAGHASVVLECDGQCYRQMMEAGAAWLEHHIDYINSLNVYPVPDGDTGINMHLTMQAAVREMVGVAVPSLGSLAKAVAHGSLMGARGNSGVILSQVLRGMAKVLGELKTFAADDLAAALKEGCATAYHGVIKPVEGTILTVARESAEACAVAAAKVRDIAYVLEQTVEEAKRSVERTPQLLDVLAEAGVVDAGGQGLCIILEGALRALKGETIEVASAVANLAYAHVGGGEDYGFDTQFLLSGRNLPLLEIRKAIASMGESVAVVGDGNTIKVHIHTEQPGAVIDYGVQFGDLTDIVVENLQTQYEAFTADAHGEAVGADGSLGGIAVVAVVPSAGFRRVFESLGVSAIVSGGQTMNPSTEDILNAVDSVSANDVIILPNNANIVMAARQAQVLSSKNIAVVAAKTLPQGIGALLALNYQADLEANASLMEKALTEVQTIEVTIAVRSAKFDGVAVKKGHFIALVDGVLAASGSVLDDVVSEALTQVDLDGREIITLYTGEDVTASDATALAERIRATFPGLEAEVLEGGQPHYHYIVSVE